MLSVCKFPEARRHRRQPPPHDGLSPSGHCRPTDSAVNMLIAAIALMGAVADHALTFPLRPQEEGLHRRQREPKNSHTRLQHGA